VIRKRNLIPAALLLSAIAIFAQDEASWLKGTTDEKLKTLASIQPGLGTVMVEYSTRAANVYYAAQAGNWGLAAYQLNEMTEIQEVAENTRPTRAKALQAFEKGSLSPVARDILNQDLSAFRADFTKMVTQCNSCHRAAGYGFIVYKLPVQPPTPVAMDTTLKFTRADLEKLLGGLAK
jgi:hypothetical protein